MCGFGQCWAHCNQHCHQSNMSVHITSHSHSIVDESTILNSLIKSSSIVCFFPFF